MQLRLLGPVVVQDPSGDLPVGGPKERAVLAVLGTHAGQMVSEDQLIDALWDDPPRTAGRTLQSYISRIRKGLGGASEITIDAVPGGYRLRAEPHAIDVSLVEALQEQASTTADDTQRASLLTEALSLFSGRPLGEFADEPWAEAESARLNELRSALTEARIDADLDRGRHASLVGELETHCRHNPFRERLWAQRMIALYRCGRQAEALAVARELRRRLVDELGVEPSPDLKDLERAILTQDASLGIKPTPSAGERIPFPAGLASAGSSAFVGREKELDELRTCWSESTNNGGCRAIFVGGEPGIGKSRLVAEFAREVFNTGATILFGTCEEELDVSYQPFAEALRPFIARCSIDLLRAHVRRHGGDLARLAPELALRLDDVPAPMQAEPESERYRLFEATAAIIEAAASESPVLLVVDDLQWANKPTLLLLRHLLRQPRSAGLMVIGMYRDTETSDILTDTLADLRTFPYVGRIFLDGLDEDGVVDYLEAAGGRKLEDAGLAFARRLWEETSGSPFFVGEVIRHLIETGALEWTSASPMDQFDLPASVREVIARRVGRLSEPTRNMLSLAAIIGPVFTLPVLERSNELSGDALLTAIEEAVTAGFIRDVPTRPATYTFAHALVRNALHDQISALRRARMHRRVAEALESANDGPGEHLPEIAVHYLAAATDGVADKAIEYASRAAERAIERVAYEEAVRFYEEALEVAEWAGLQTTATFCDLLLGLARAHWKVGEVLPSRATYDRAADVARRIDDPERFGIAALRSPADLGGFAHAMATDQGLVDLLEEALTRLPR